MFTKLDAATTGLVVQNSYDDAQMWGSRYRAYMGGAVGSGVAAGDFDGDGKVDLFVSTKTKPGRLFKNLGGWKFVDVTESAGLDDGRSMLGWMKDAVSPKSGPIWNEGAVFADVNNDGRLDLFVCRNNAPNLLYINQGDGTFKEEAEKRGLALVDGSVVGAFADYDRDGWLDVLVLTNQVEGVEPFGRPDHLYHNDGDGHFTDVTPQSGIAGETFGHAATWFDYDGDGWPDLYITNDFSGPDRLYHNNRNGTFTNVLDRVVPHTPYSSMGADVADINNDGYFDFFVADMATTTREKDRRGLAASRDEVLMTGMKYGGAPQYARNALLLNTGTGVFREAACWAGIEATDWTWAPRFEDFDNDGWVDLHITNGMIREANNSDVLNRMMRALSDAERIRVMKASPVLNESNLAFRNLRGVGFAPVTKAWGLGDIGVSFGSATADFDNDGDLDLVYINYNGGLSVFRNDVTGQHRLQVRLQGRRSNRFGVGATVRVESASVGPQARTMTIARGYASSSENVAHFGLGADRTASRLEIDWPSGTKQVFTDVPADMSYVVTEAADGSVAEPSKTAPLFREATPRVGLAASEESPLTVPDREQAFIPFRTDRRGPGVAVADVDGDGHDDIFMAATVGGPARLFRWKSGGYQVEVPSGLPTEKAEEGPPLFFDADGNGTQDLLITKAGADRTTWPDAFKPVIYANDGTGKFSPTKWLPPLTLNVGAACAADIDGDGDLDLFLGGRSVPGHYPEAPQSVLLRNDHGHFTDITGKSPGLGTIGLVKSALFRDVDGDGRPDLIVAAEWDYIRYLHNDGDGVFNDWTEKAGFTSGGRGWWNSLASADFNGDGRPDFAVGNLGLNTTYRASAAHPVTLYYGDFANNGTRMLAEAVYDGDRLYPARSRADIGARLPQVLRKFPRNDDFARADMAQVFGAQALASATAYHADNLESGVFLSQPDGTYRFQSFPRLAQIGPMLGIVAEDLDGDGHADVCAVQNTSSAAPHFDGGVGIFLRGSGAGQFTALEPVQSGVVVTGNGCALTVVESRESTSPSLFVTRRGGPTAYLANQAASDRWLRIQFRGATGNAHGVGARVTLKFSDGTRYDNECGLGGGWLTQSAARLWAAVPAGASIVATEIRWPDGRVSHPSPPPARGLWTITEPSTP